MKRMMAAALALGLASMAQAHEFWIDAQQWQVSPGDPIVANLKVGENFAGSTYAFVPRNFTRFELVIGEDVFDVPGRAGDRPALNVTAPGDGLAVAVHVTRDYTLTYSEWQKWLDFTGHKDFPEAAADHVARGLPQTGFVERYSRHAKAMVGMGDSTGADREMGLRTEIVALANPYTDDLGGFMPVTVLFNGAPRADSQIELFERAPDDSVTAQFYRTDRDGNAMLPVKAGHDYLVDAVMLLPVQPGAGDKAVWESLWASLTFAVPAE